MKKFLGFMIFAVLVFSLGCMNNATNDATDQTTSQATNLQDQSVKVGDYGFVDFTLIRVYNPEPIKNAYRSYKYGDLCYAEKGDRYTIISIDNDLVLVRLDWQFREVDRGQGYCPPETLIVMSEWSFIFERDEYLKKITEKQRERDFVRRVTGK